MGAEISQAGTERQNSRSPKEIVIRSMQNQSMVDKRDERARGSYSYDHTSESKRQYIGSGTYTQRGHEQGDTAGVSGTGRIFVGE